MKNSMVKFGAAKPLFTLVWGLAVSSCFSQAPVSPETRQVSQMETPTLQVSNEDKNGRELKSVITQIQDTSQAFDWFRFYNSEGRCVKTLRSGQFELKHPVYQLNFPTYDSKDKKYFDYYYFKPLEEINFETEELTPLVDRSKKIEELQSLKKYGMVVKEPEKATHIIAKLNSGYTYWNELVTQPTGKYLCKIENVVVIDQYNALSVSRHDDVLANSLLDCAHITIYNYLGEIHKEIIIPDKLLRFALVSDDGKYLVCESYNVIANETSGGYPITSYLVVDLETKKIDYLSRPEFRQARANDPLFADEYFQITFNTSTNMGQVCTHLFIDPYSRNYYIKTYHMPSYRDKKVIHNKSFMRYEGVKEDITQFTKYSY